MNSDRITSFDDLAETAREGVALTSFLNEFIDARLRHHRILCGQPGCDLRAEQPQVTLCTRVDCPMRQREAA